VQDERRPLGWRQGVQYHLQRVARLLSEQHVGFRVRRSNVGRYIGLGHRPGTSLAKLVKAQPSDNGREPGGRVVDIEGTGESEPGLLQDVVGIGLRPEDPGGDCR
jgi:hypothetical protein